MSRHQMKQPQIRQAPVNKELQNIMRLRGEYKNLYQAEHKWIDSQRSADPAVQAKIDELSVLLHTHVELPGSEHFVGRFAKLINELTNQNGKIYKLYSAIGRDAQLDFAIENAYKAMLDVFKDAFDSLCKKEKDWVSTQVDKDADMQKFIELIDSYKIVDGSPEELVSLIDKMTDPDGMHCKLRDSIEKLHHGADAMHSDMHKEELYARKLIFEVKDCVTDPGYGDDDEEFLDAEDGGEEDEEGNIFYEPPENLRELNFQNGIDRMVDPKFDIHEKMKLINQELNYLRVEGCISGKDNIHIIHVKEEGWLRKKLVYNHEDIRVQDIRAFVDDKADAVDIDQIIGWVEYKQIEAISGNNKGKIESNLKKLPPEIRLATEISYIEHELAAHSAEYDKIQVTVKTPGKFFGAVEKHESLTEFLQESILHACNDIRTDHIGTGLKYMDHCVEAIHKAGAVTVFDFTH